MNTAILPVPTVHEQQPIRPEAGTGSVPVSVSAGPRSTPTLTSRDPQGASVSTLCEMGALIRTRPSLTSPAREVAAWYERKAALLHHIATETGDPGTERRSRAARDHAIALSTGGAA